MREIARDVEPERFVPKRIKIETDEKNKNPEPVEINE